MFSRVFSFFEPLIFNILCEVSEINYIQYMIIENYKNYECIEIS